MATLGYRANVKYISTA